LLDVDQLTNSVHLMATKLVIFQLVTCVLVPSLCSAQRATRFHDARLTVAKHRQLSDVLEGAWKTVDLAAHKALATDLEAYIAGKSQERLEGHSGLLVIERKLYHALANISSVNHICEIGLNAGHSAAMWLLANKHATVTMFDMFSHKYTEFAVQYLTSKDAEVKHGLVNAPQRLRVVPGNSLLTLPTFAAENPHHRCDLLSVDGGHAHDIAVADIKNMRNLANTSFNVLLVDDTNCEAEYCVDKAVIEHEKRGTIRVLQSYAENKSGDGFLMGVTVAEYVR